MNYYRLQYGESFQGKTEKLYDLENQQELLSEIWSKGYEEIKLYKYTRQMNGSFIGQPIRSFK